MHPEGLPSSERRALPRTGPWRSAPLTRPLPCGLRPRGLPAPEGPLKPPFCKAGILVAPLTSSASPWAPRAAAVFSVGASFSLITVPESRLSQLRRRPGCARTSASAGEAPCHPGSVLRSGAAMSGGGESEPPAVPSCSVGSWRAAAASCCSRGRGRRGGSSCLPAGEVRVTYASPPQSTCRSVCPGKRLHPVRGGVSQQKPWDPQAATTQAARPEARDTHDPQRPQLTTEREVAS